MAAVFQALTPAVSAKQVKAQSKDGRRRRRKGKRGNRSRSRD